MNNEDLLTLIIKYQETKLEIYLNKIIYKLLPLVNEYLEKIPTIDKEDMKQEFIFIIYLKVKNLKIHYLYLDKNIFNLDNLHYLINNNFSQDSCNQTFNNKYVYNLINKLTKEEKEKIFYDSKYRDLFICNFAKYTSKNKLYKLIKLSFKSKIAKYYKNKEKIKQTISLNNLDINNIEYMEMIHNNPKYKFDWDIFEKKDKKFIFSCIENNRLLTQKEIAKKLNISQQAVSKRFHQIKEKYKNKINF